MAIPLNDNIQVDAPKPSDPRYFSSANIPWTSIAAVNAGIPSTKRYPGLTVRILSVEYHYKNGIEDTDLVVKSNNIYIYDFISTEGQQEFIIPFGYSINSVFLNRTFLLSSEYTFINNILTIIENLETGTIISTR